MRLLIIDNDLVLCSAIRILLQSFCPEISSIEEAYGVQSGIQKIIAFQPAIVLLDVELSDGTGFDLMKQIPYPSFQLIFVTAHNQYAVDAFQFSAIDYLMKPVDPDALQKSIQRAITNIRNIDTGRQVEFLLQHMAGSHDKEKKIVLKDIDNIHFIKVADILYCMAEGTYTKFYIKDKSMIMVSKNLKEYENMLEPLGFIRTHHSYLVNTAKIDRFDKTDGGTLILEGDIKIPLAQRKKEWVLNFLEGKG